MKQSIRLGTLGGIPIGVNWSVLLILALIAWELATYVLPAQAGSATGADWIAGALGALALLISLLVHEVSHAVVAKRNDVRVRSITLFVFGGVTQLEGQAHTPGADFRIAAVGPATSVVLAGFFAATEAVVQRASVHGLAVATLSWLWGVNLVLAAFNLIPAAPLDGGRVLRAGLWRHSGDRNRASVIAARFGRGFGGALIAFGLLGLLYSGVVGLWFVLIGYFLYSGARAEEQFARASGAVESLRVIRVMNPRPLAVPRNTTVPDLVARYLWNYRGDALAVTDENGFLAGVVTAEAVMAVPAHRRSETRLVDIAVPLAAVPLARPDGPMGDLLERMMSHDGNPALVLDAENRLVGIVSIADIQRATTLVGGAPFWGTRHR